MGLQWARAGTAGFSSTADGGGHGGKPSPRTDQRGVTQDQEPRPCASASLRRRMPAGVGALCAGLGEEPAGCRTPRRVSADPPRSTGTRLSVQAERDAVERRCLKGGTVNRCQEQAEWRLPAGERSERPRARPLVRSGPRVVQVGQCSSWWDASISERLTGAMRSSKKKVDTDARTRCRGVICPFAFGRIISGSYSLKLSRRQRSYSSSCS